MEMWNTDEMKVYSSPGFRRFHFDRRYNMDAMRVGAISLVQMGDSVCDSGFSLGPHPQICYEISYIVSGHGWFGLNGEKYPVGPGDVFLCGPNDSHEGGVDPADPYRYLYLGFNFNMSEQQDNPYLHIREMLDEVDHPCCQDRLDMRTPFVRALNELSNESQFSEQMIQMYAEQIVVLAFRNFCSDWAVRYPGDALEQAGKGTVYSAIHYIDNHLMHIKDPKEIADEFGYSVSYLSHLFFKETGDSLRNYYMKQKWKKATELLCAGHHTITQIADMMRYDSIHSFSRAFRNMYGMSPSQYVKQHKR